MQADFQINTSRETKRQIDGSTSGPTDSKVELTEACPSQPLLSTQTPASQLMEPALARNLGIATDSSPLPLC